MERPRITVFDTTLRDGEQSPGCSMNVQEKLRMAQQLDRLGVDVIEAGFPIASDGDFEAVQAVAASIRRPVITGLARACTVDIERAWQALKNAARPRIHVFLATSDIHLKHKLRMSRQQCLEQARDAVRLAKSLCEDVEFSPEDATRTHTEFLCQVLEAVADAGATTLNIYDTSVVSDRLYPTSQLLSEITGVAVQPNKAIIGRNAFAHEAGIHQDGVLKNPLTYEIMTPQSVGVPDSTLVLGKHSGRHALGLRCEQLGFQFERRELDEIYRRFVILADKIKTIQDHHLLELIRKTFEQMQRVPPAHVGEIPMVFAASASSGHTVSSAAYFSKPSALPLPVDSKRRDLPLNSKPDHHCEQEDYLWGV